MDHYWSMDVTLADKLFRTTAIYVFLLLALRMAGKRQVSQMTPFDLVVLLLISNVVQNAIIGPDNSLTGGLIGAAFILLLNAGVTAVAYKFKFARRVLTGEPTLLVHNGVILRDKLKRERVPMDDLLAAFRAHGIADASHVRVAVLEPNGQISIIPRDPNAKPFFPNDPGTS
jgi:uncharacterized membrane protein YcaP (DUF421 family)